MVKCTYERWSNTSNDLFSECNIQGIIYEAVRLRVRRAQEEATLIILGNILRDKFANWDFLHLDFILHPHKDWDEK